jgi:hypothetical protein
MTPLMIGFHPKLFLLPFLLLLSINTNVRFVADQEVNILGSVN